MKGRVVLTILIVTAFLLSLNITCTKSEKTETQMKHPHMTEYIEKSGDYMKQALDSPEAKVGDKLICPVMNSKFTVKEDSNYFVYNGKKYYVCCPACIAKLKENPEKYLKK